MFHVIRIDRRTGRRVGIGKPFSTIALARDAAAWHRACYAARGETSQRIETSRTRPFAV
jgi:hypothetical protein